MKFEVLEFDDANQRLEEALSDNFEGGYETVLFIDGDASFEGDFLEELEKICKDDYELIAINGDLEVKGRLASYESTPGLYVSGHTSAETLEGGDCEIYLGEGRFDYFVFGYYNDGILETGSVETPWLINSNHDLRVSSDDATSIDNYGDDDDYDFGSENIAESFVAEVLSDDDPNEIDIEAFYTHLKEGKRVLKPGAMTAAQAALAEIERAFEEKRVRLDLRERKIKGFPERICQMHWLEELDLGQNELKVIPPEIGQLQKLEVLRLDRCGLAELPPEIGSLEKLRVLHLAANSIYDWDQEPSQVPIRLPETFGNLSSLEELDLSSLSTQLEQKDRQVLADMTPYRLPESAGQLKALRVLTADGTNLVFPESMYGLASLEEVSFYGGSWAYLKELPAGLTTMKNLRKLDLRGNFLREIPESITELSELEELGLSGALCLLERPVPDLSPLTKLRILRFNGSSSHTGVKRPKHEVLAPLFQMSLPALEELEIDRWGEQKDIRPRLGADFIAKIGNFSGLRRIDLSFNGLESLPESFFGLKELEEVNLQYNALTKTRRKELAGAFPKTKLDLRNQRLPEGTTDDDIEIMIDIVRQANKARDSKDFDRALKLYDEVLEQIDNGSIDSPYNQLYCLYGKAWVYSQRGYQMTGIAEEEVKASRELGVAASDKALSLVPTVWFHFTDEGQFQREVVRFCGNFIAWELYDAAQGEDDPRLQRALETIERSAECIDGSQHFYILDTQVRILLKMERSKEAYRIVHKVLLQNPDFKDFADLKVDSRYQAWLAAL
jgi:Leucine-rich repeat (LRR) protein